MHPGPSPRAGLKCSTSRIGPDPGIRSVGLPYLGSQSASGVSFPKGKKRLFIQLRDRHRDTYRGRVLRNVVLDYKETRRENIGLCMMTFSNSDLSCSLLFSTKTKAGIFDYFFLGN